MTTFSIDPADEGMHEPTEDPQFNESMYFNFVEPATGFATLIRMGNRVNEGHSEVTVLVYLPGGGAAIRFDRAPISDNKAFDAAGLRFEVIDPLQEMRVTFDGEGHRLAQGIDLADPKQAFNTSPVVPISLSLDYTTIALHGMGETEDASGGLAGGHEAIAVGHYQGPCRVKGSVTVGEEKFDVDGIGFRDHSWGPRRWQAPRWWRWVSCLVDERTGFVGWLTRTGDEVAPGTGMVLRDGEISLVRDVTMTSTYGDEAPHYPETLDITMRTDDGELHATGRVYGIVPLRHRKEGTVARLAEVLVEYVVDGRTGYGISEYHDLMVDGVPVGRTEA
jgi:hypothetical protein